MQKLGIPIESVVQLVKLQQRRTKVVEVPIAAQQVAPGALGFLSQEKLAEAIESLVKSRAVSH
jgi:phage gp46-like protein